MADRPLFDPSRIRPPAEPAQRDAVPATLSVRQVNELIRGAVNRYLPATLHVLGEIGDLSRPDSGHAYFTLKDDASELRCVMWRSAAVTLKFRLEPGLDVIATGAIEVYLPRGAYQLIVRRLEPRGVGALEIALRQLKEKLEREGLFDPARKKPLPAVPRRVAVVTSPSGAVIRDIVQTVRRRFAAVELLLFPVRVQGEGAAGEIAAAIRILNQHAAALGGIDVAIVARGGGSLEDLWAFNEEVVARGIFASRVPIVSGVGHEIDVTISDLVADLRAPTPTAAAELVTPKMSDLIAWLARQTARGTRRVRHVAEVARAGLERAAAYHGLARPMSIVSQRAQLVDERTQRLKLDMMHRLRGVRARLGRAEMAVLRFGAGAQFARLDRGLARQVARVHQAVGRLALRCERRLNDRMAGVRRATPQLRVERLSEHVRQALLRMTTAMRQSLHHRRGLLALRLEAITVCDPKRVLARGYSITRDARTRRVLRSVAEIRDGLRIITQLSDGEFRGTAEDPKQPRLFEP